MTRKKKNKLAQELLNVPGISAPLHKDGMSEASTKSTPFPPLPNKSKANEPSTSTLIICRNKHWRYISSFHGPWLHLPPEVLESLAFSNFISPRPRPIDPAVFFDIVKIRRLVEDATNLAVRAANGTTASSLSNTLNAGSSLLGGGSAASLGLGLGGSGGNAKLSRERKHRMRELATQKLSEAYHLDEIASSVSTMQSASSLEEVAKLVLQRNANDADAKYVHFFHEKIPSRMLAQCTSLLPLDEVIQDRPNDSAPLRTRAVTRIFKDDHVGAVRDLTEALAICRYSTAQHNAERGQLELANGLGGSESKYRNAKEATSRFRVEKENKPSSLEPQLLFHRAGVYLALACQHIHQALGIVHVNSDMQTGQAFGAPQNSHNMTADEKVTQDSPTAARQVVKTYAKRALRDYIAFLSYFDYTLGLPIKLADELSHKVDQITANETIPTRLPSLDSLNVSGNSTLSNGNLFDALTEKSKHRPSNHCTQSVTTGFNKNAKFPALEVCQVSSLFSSAMPNRGILSASDSQSLVPRSQSDVDLWLAARTEPHEAVTYHPLLTDALHSVLLCHCLMQTSSKEHLRHAHTVARLARVCDGYPIFLAARSPSRADWIEVIRRASNWIGLRQSWETMCSPAPLPGHYGSPQTEETEEQMEERCKQEAIMEALADERVHDETSFEAVVAGRETRVEEQKQDHESQNGSAPQRWAQSDGKEYPVSTERAEAVAKWIREAPRFVKTAGKSKHRSKKCQGAHTEVDVHNAYTGSQDKL